MTIAGILTALALALVAYASTNLDNLLIISSLAAAQADRGAIVRGYLFAAVTVLVLSLGFMSLKVFITTDALAYLGLIPLALGVHLLVRPGQDASESRQGSLKAGAIALMLVANSTDTVAVFGPLFAESESGAVAAMAVGFLACAALWLLLVFRLAGRIRNMNLEGGLFARIPGVIMILVGLYILADTATDLQ